MELSGAVLFAVALCVVSAGAYAIGALVQERVAEQPMWVLVRMPRWWLAVASNAFGALLHVVALRYGALTVVQALGVLTLVLAVPLGATVARRRVGRAEGGATALACVGLVGLMALIGSTPAVALTGRQLVGLLLVTASALVLLAGRSRLPGASGLWAATAGGTAFGVASAVTQTLTVQIAGTGHTAVTRPAGITAILAVAGLNVAGVWFTQLSYRHGLAAPLALSTMANPVAAAAIGLILLGEHVRAGSAGMALAALCAAAVAVAVRQLTTTRSPVGPLTAGAAYQSSRRIKGALRPAATPVGRPRGPVRPVGRHRSAVPGGTPARPRPCQSARPCVTGRPNGPLSATRDRADRHLG
ncbi:hypothetical protein [Micromonospora sp. NPDC003776]